MLIRKDLLENLINLAGEMLNAKSDEKVEWITVKGNHIPIKKGQSKDEAVKSFLSKVDSSKTKQKSIKDIVKSVSESNKKGLTIDDVINKTMENKYFTFTKEQLLKRINDANEYNKTVIITKDKYKDKNGEYTPERQEVHDKIMDDIFKNSENAKPKNGEKPTSIFLGGRGGSGKSKFEGMVYNEKNYIVLDTDAVKEMLPEYKGFNAWEVHEESSDIINRALLKAKQDGLNVVLDATMKTESSTEKKIKSFANDGYEIEMHYMHLPREISIQRAISRFMGKDGKKEGGRYVPISVLLGMKDNEANFDNLKKYAKKWSFYDNNVINKETPPKLIAKS